MKQCNKCRKHKTLNDFAKNRAARDGLQGSCRECGRTANRKSYLKHQDRNKQWYQDNKEFHLQRQKKYRDANVERYRALGEKYRSGIDGRAKTLLNGAKQRARSYGMDFNLCLGRIRYALLVGKCERTGVPFDYEKHDRYQYNPLAPSVDRKDPFKGYTYDNIQIVCNAYNLGKNQMSDDEYIAFCKIVAENCK